MKYLTLSRFEYLYIASLLLSSTLVIIYGPSGFHIPSIIMSGISFMSFMAIRFTYAITQSGEDIKSIQEDIANIKVQLVPVKEATFESSKEWRVESIPRLLSLFKTDDGLTLLQVITEASDDQTQALNLVKAQNVILNSIKHIKL